MLNPLKVFYSYSHRDERLRERLEKSLASLRRQQLIEEWHDRKITAGSEWDRDIDKNLNSADIILFLVSPDFIASSYCYDIEVTRAMERHNAGEAQVLPIILRPCDWMGAPFGHLQALPKDARAVTTWANRDLAFNNIAEGIKRVVRELAGKHEIKDRHSAGSAGGAELRVASIDDVLQWQWDGQKLLEELIKLDYETTDELTPAHEGEPEQWGPIFMNHPETWRLLITEPGHIVGYWHIAPLFPKEYELAKKGTLLDSQITVDGVQFFNSSGQYDVYFVQICMHPQYRRPRHLRLLFETIYDVFDRLSAEGIFIREVCANAYTKVGVSFCRSFNLEPSCKHSEHGMIYTAPIAPIAAILRDSLAVRFPKLYRRYKQEGLI